MTDFWSEARRRLFPRLGSDVPLPRSLLNCFGIPEELAMEPLLRCLLFMSPSGASLVLCEHAQLWPGCVTQRMHVAPETAHLYGGLP